MGTKLVYGAGGGSGLAELPVKDEGVAVGNAKSFNFVGNDVQAVAGTGGEIIIQIPPSPYAPFFNNPGALVGNVTAVNRLVSNPTAEGTPFKLGDWLAGSSRACINTTSMVYQTGGDFSIQDNSTTTVKVEILDADGVTVIATNTQTITGNLDNTVNDIRIEIFNFSDDSDRYKARFRTTINIQNILPEGGRFSVKITHDNKLSGVYGKEQLNLFLDTNPVNPTMNNPTLSENTPSLVYLSGVRFYGTGSTFNVGIANINNINNRSYVSNFIQINGVEIGVPLMNIQGAGLNSWDTQFNNTGATYLNSGYSVVSPNFYNKGNLKIQARWIDWITNAYQDSLTISAIISTYTDNSTNKLEDFRNESKRLMSDYTTAWDSQQYLNSYDGNNGLQVINSKLIYPQEDFTIYNPDISNQPDYSLVSGDKVFIRRFWIDNISKSNGVLTFGGHNITETMITNKDVEIKVSIDKVNWFIVNDDYLGGTINDGDGCRVDIGAYALNINNSIKFTLGTGKFTSAGSLWGIWVQIIYKDTVSGKGAEIDSVQMSDW